MELVIYNPQIPEMIKFNNEELIKELTEKLGHYNNLTYTDNEIKTAKADRATLNKFKLAIDTRRKEIKVQCMKPYEDFEGKVKQIIQMIDKPILAIDTQVKTYEERVKSEKRSEIIAFFNESIGELAELVPIEKVWIEKWLNVAETMNAIKNDITLVLSKVRNDLECISGLQSEFELQITETYLTGLNLTQALTAKKVLEDQKAKREAYNKSQEEAREHARIKAEERAIEDAERVKKVSLARELERKQAESIPTPEPEYIGPEPVAYVIEEIAQEIVPVVEELKQVDISVWVTPDLLEALEGFLQAYEIKYERMN
jgi:protein-tyrosine phosphatase